MAIWRFITPVWRHHQPTPPPPPRNMGCYLFTCSKTADPFVCVCIVSVCLLCFQIGLVDIIMHIPSLKSMYLNTSVNQWLSSACPSPLYSYLFFPFFSRFLSSPPLYPLSVLLCPLSANEADMDDVSMSYRHGLCPPAALKRAAGQIHTLSFCTASRELSCKKET